MRKLTLFTFLMLVGGLIALPANAAQNKVNQCHYTGAENGHVLLTIAEAGLNGHDDHEDDGAIGAPVPNMPGFIFDATCQPEAAGPAFLVRAVSTDSTGAERLIAELLDTNSDGVPSPGDTARFYEYPNDFTGTSYTAFGATECIIDTATLSGTEEVMTSSATDLDCQLATWNSRTVSGDAFERFRLTYSDGATITQVDLLDNESFFASDFIRVNNLGPQVTSSTNDVWLDVEINF